MAGRNLTPPDNLKGDGIVYVGEGTYVTMLQVAVRIAREAGCSLPIQLWHREPVGDAFRGLGVELREVNAWRQHHPITDSHGWQKYSFALKNYAVAHSGFARVLFMDADAYLVRDPQLLFDALETYPIIYGQNLHGWDSYIDRSFLKSIVTILAPEVQGGAYLFDCKTAWRELMLTRWINEHRGFWWHKNRSEDEDAIRLAISLLKTPYLCLNNPWVGAGFVAEFAGERYVVHRCQGKLFRGRVPRRCSSLPMEERVFEIFQELSPTYQEQREEGAKPAARRPNVPNAKHS